MIPSGSAEEREVIAVVFENGDINYNPPVGAPFELQVIMLNPTDQFGFDAFEFKFKIPTNTFILSTILPPNSINIGIGEDFIVGVANCVPPAAGNFEFVTMTLLLRFVAKVSPVAVMRLMSPAMLTAFSTASSSATLPITMDCVEEKAGVPNHVSSFVLPLGATINMNGTALYECGAVLFLAQAYGIDLGLAEQFLVVVTALVTSIGVAGIPSASLVAIAIILAAVGLPVEAIAVLFVFDRVLDMARTSVNVFGDCCCAVIVARLEGERVSRTLLGSEQQYPERLGEI